ncbi:S8 family serine peptidase [Palleronia sp.]|uniref:S8 family peptidase n=1 Tax=Palleronia sp. TaxID=1940284 RepID=UPI0035C7C0BB
MPSRYDRSHIDISARFTRRDFIAPAQNLSGGGTPRARATHGGRLRGELATALEAYDRERPQDDRLDPIEGVFLELELARGTPIEAMERKRDGVMPTAARVENNDRRTVGLFVPNDARPVLDQILSDYATGPLTPAGDPQRKGFVEPIEEIRRARFETFWTDDDARLPEDPTDQIWWEVWCVRSAEKELDALVERLDARAASRDERLYFPEAVVIPVLCDRVTIELMLFSRFAITELRRASDSPTVFLDADRDEQIGWSGELAERVVWPGSDAPAVCLLDTGVNRAHDLLEPAVSTDELHAVDASWGVDDSGAGHGTSMAGLALHGDLTPHLASMDVRPLLHRLESVKLLPPVGHPPTEDRFYGPVTQSAIVIPEIERPTRARVFCMAVTNDNVSGARPTTWSAALDQAAAGAMIGDEETPRRLIVTSTGNAPNHIERHRIVHADHLPIEDPAQAWNVLTIGGYTDKIEITEGAFAHYRPFAEAGDLSPHTRTSTSWAGKSPFKPDLLMEAGNRALSPTGTDVLDADSLGLLSTGPDTDRQPLIPFRATSAATASAARLAARLMAAHPDYWPETIRALMVHGAEWTPPMRAALDVAEGLRETAALLRRYGYGVANFERANASATNHLALVSQAAIQPYRARPTRGFKDCHFYPLPWPREELERLGDADVELKITLSYFIEPNPGISAAIDPYRYQSFGLRFDLRRRDETVRMFAKRVSKAERDDGERIASVADDNRWLFGPDSISAGSLHCDVWTGPAARLLTRDTICVRPIGGWWRNRADVATCERKTRYALVVSLKTDDVEVDLHTPIDLAVRNTVGIEIGLD